MALAANATMTCASYRVEHNGIRVYFVCPSPGGGEPSDYDCFLTDAELAGVPDVPALRTLVTTKLSRRYRATGLGANLDGLMGQSVTI